MTVMYSLDEAAKRINKEFVGVFEVTPRILCDMGRIYGELITIRTAFSGKAISSSQGKTTIPDGHYFEVPSGILFEFETSDTVSITRLYDGKDVIFPVTPKTITINKLRILVKDVLTFINEFRNLQRCQKLAQALRNHTPKKIKPKPESKKTEIKGEPKQIIIAAFAEVYFDEVKWARNLADPQKWLKDCRVMKGNAKESAIWNPVDIGIALTDKDVSITKLDNIFKEWANWKDEWEEKSDHLRLKMP